MKISGSRKREIIKSTIESAYREKSIAIEKSKKVSNRIEMQDTKYSSIVIAIKNELTKRKINITDNNFEKNIDEIISNALKIPSISKRYPDAEIVEIRNAVKRSINREINNSENNKSR